MILHHGTTMRRAQQICVEGFKPRKPSRRVWFARGRNYAMHRARTQARRAHDRPVVIACELDVQRLRLVLGAKRVIYRSGILAVDGPIGTSVVRGGPDVGIPGTPKEMATWINRILGLKQWKGVSRRHGGIERLCRWVARRREAQRGITISPTEVLALARQWLPEYFKNVAVYPDHLCSWPKVGAIDVVAEPLPQSEPAHDDQAIRMLEDDEAAVRLRGLVRLEEAGDPDLFDWCALCLDDESIYVREAALRTMQRCEDVDCSLIEPLAIAEDKRIRAAAIGVLVRHAGDDAARWFERGLKDPSTHVRLAAARQLHRLEAAGHRSVFHLALADPNPQIVKYAADLTAHKGYAPLHR